MGASLGIVLGSLLGLPGVVCAALGYAAVFGGATNTLIAPMLIGLEVFGVQNALAFVIVCSVAYIGKWKSFHLHGTAACRGDKKKCVSVKWDR